MSTGTLRHEYARQIITDYHQSLSQIPPMRGLPVPLDNAAVKIGIIGAGASGLYIALMLEWLKKNAEMTDFTYDLLEANPDPKRIGGRIYTHYFEEVKFDYYDVGAMRFPDLPWMTPVFDLMTYLNITVDNGLRIRYIMSDERKNNMSFYNEVALTQKQVDEAYGGDNFNPFKTSVVLTKTPDDTINGIIGGLKKKLVEDWKAGWANLMAYDNFSTRMFMSSGTLEAPLSQPTISYLETLSSATGLYDCALSETVFDSLDFDYPGKTKWYCILGGAGLIASNAREKIQAIQYGQRVTAIKPLTSVTGGVRSIDGVQLTINDTNQATYDHVISTIPLGCLSVVDTSECGFNWDLRSAIRELHYDSSVKIAIKFSERWWEKLSNPQIGGVSSTDRPTRVVVYPSYGINDPNAPATILVSYTWAQDALRLGSLMQGTEGQKHMLNVILKDLADIHGIKDYKYLPGLVKSYHAFDWYSSEFSMGAFALYGPGQFRTLYKEITKPAFGRLHFAGEATSVHHAWLNGALNSAFRSLSQVFMAHGRNDLIAKLKANGSPFKNAGAWELPDNLVKDQVALGLAHMELLAGSGDE